MGIYASKTTVSPEKSKGEIEAMLRRYGAVEFASAWQANKAIVIFTKDNRRIRFDLPLPNRDDFKETEDGYVRTSEKAIDAAHGKAIRQVWRSLALAIKGKLVSVEDGIESFEDAFLSHIILPNGQRYGEWSAPQIAAAYEKKVMPPLLGAG